MKAVLLAGGLGTRMGELTRVTNKHLLPVGSKPMIFWPLEFLVACEFTEILIVVGHKGCGEILRQVGDGSKFGAKVYYAFQEREDGIAAALKQTQGFIGDQPLFPVLLGDNIFDGETGSFTEALPTCMERCFNRQGTAWRDWTPTAAVFITMHAYPQLFGVVQFKHPSCPTDRAIERIVEKPADPPSRFVVTGLYIYDGTVWERLETLRPSNRHELEITDLNNSYAEEGNLLAHVWAGEWIDAGTPELYFEANLWAQKKEGLVSIGAQSSTAHYS